MITKPVLQKKLKHSICGGIRKTDSQIAMKGGIQAMKATGEQSIV